MKVGNTQMNNTMQLIKETHHTKIAMIHQTKINVVDSIMGSGKTSWSIQHMNVAPEDKNFIYITPFLSEVKRVKESVTSRKFAEPTNKGKGKMDNLKKLILNENNIVSTHALFQHADKELIKLLKAGNYTLILDEAMNVVDQFDLTKDSFELLQDNKMIFVEEDGLIRWNEESKYQDTDYNTVKNLAITENLYYFENTILFWTFPVSTFNAFEEVYILTYLFQSQQQKYYYDMFKLDYSYKAVEKLGETYVLVDHEKRTSYDKTLMKSLINIYDGKLNNIGDDKHALSVSWFKKPENANLKDKLKKNLYTYFRRNVSTPSIANMWTCFKKDIPQLVGNGYKGVKHKDGEAYSKKECFLPFNIRATNDFKHKESLAYVINRYMHPYEKKFFISKGVSVDEDIFALADLIQWIWRSRIREGEAINLYIPSKRMRTILNDYLESDL